MKTEEELIKGSVVHVMNMMMIELMRYGFLLAMENELLDLKGLVKADEQNWLTDTDDPFPIDNDLDLLRDISDKVVKQVMISIDRVAECRSTYIMINGLDMEEVMLDEDFYEEAYTSFYSYAFEMECNGTYESILENLHCFYWPLELALFHCMMQFVLNKLEVFEETDIVYHRYHCEKDFELLTEDKNAKLLLDLIAAITADAVLVEEHYWGICKGNRDGEI